MDLLSGDCAPASIIGSNVASACGWATSLTTVFCDGASVPGCNTHTDCVSCTEDSICDWCTTSGTCFVAAFGTCSGEVDGVPDDCPKDQPSGLPLTTEIIIIVCVAVGVALIMIPIVLFIRYKRFGQVCCCD